MILTRLGIAQAQAGEREKARATLQQIAGPRATVAKMWLAYLDTQAG